MVSNAQSVPPVFAVVKYLYAQIKAQGILDDYSYAGLVPIVPIQDEPALLDAIHEAPGITSAPYIVYTWYGNGVPSDYWETYDQLVLEIKSPDQKVERQILLLIQKLFSRYDKSARAVNNFVATQNDPFITTPTPFGNAYKVFDYKYIGVWASTGGSPGTADMEPVHAQVVVRVCYTWDANDEPLP